MTDYDDGYIDAATGGVDASREYRDYEYSRGVTEYRRKLEDREYNKIWNNDDDDYYYSSSSYQPSTIR